MDIEKLATALWREYARPPGEAAVLSNGNHRASWIAVAELAARMCAKLNPVEEAYSKICSDVFAYKDPIKCEPGEYITLTPGEPMMTVTAVKEALPNRDACIEAMFLKRDGSMMQVIISSDRFAAIRVIKNPYAYLQHFRKGMPA